jgi:hypothetical protein
MAFRKPFNWSALDRNNLYSMLYGVGTQIIGKTLEITELHKILSKHIKQHLPVKIKYRRDMTQEPGLIYMGGAYYSDYDRQGYTRHIEIVLSYYFFEEHLTIKKKRWERFCSLFADTILHEVIHMRQYRTRNFKTIPGYESTAYLAKQRKDQEYYGDKDEIGAYSFNIACEMFDRFGTDIAAIHAYLDSNAVKRHKRSTYHRYMRTFDWNHNHKIIRTIKKKIIQQLPYAMYGKPFKTTDYLTY